MKNETRTSRIGEGSSASKEASKRRIHYTLFYSRNNEAFYRNTPEATKIRIMAVYLPKRCLSFSFLHLIHAQISHLYTEGR